MALLKALLCFGVRKCLSFGTSIVLYSYIEAASLRGRVGFSTALSPGLSILASGVVRGRDFQPAAFISRWPAAWRGCSETTSICTYSCHLADENRRLRLSTLCATVTDTTREVVCGELEPRNRAALTAVDDTLCIHNPQSIAGRSVYHEYHCLWAVTGRSGRCTQGPWRNFLASRSAASRIRVFSSLRTTVMPRTACQKGTQTRGE
jgi:hypothetical protein